MANCPDCHLQDDIFCLTGTLWLYEIESLLIHHPWTTISCSSSTMSSFYLWFCYSSSLISCSNRKCEKGLSELEWLNCYWGPYFKLDFKWCNILWKSPVVATYRTSPQRPWFRIILPSTQLKKEYVSASTLSLLVCASVSQTSDISLVFCITSCAVLMNLHHRIDELKNSEVRSCR